MTMMYPKGPEVRALLLVQVDEGTELEAAQRLLGLVLRQQWTPEWSIKRVDVVDLRESRGLRKFPPAKGAEFNLSIAIKASGRTTGESHFTLERAFREIAGVLKLQDPVGLILEGSFGADW